MLFDKTDDSCEKIPFNPPIDMAKFDSVILTLPSMPKSFLEVQFDPNVSLLIK